MKPARIAILVVSIAAAGAAALLASGRKPPDQIVREVIVSSAPTLRVLVTRVALGLGQTIQDADIDWQPWPKEATTSELITDADAPGAKADIVGSVVRSSFVSGEPVRREKLAKVNGSGFMSAILPSGKRAVAITTDTQGSATAGGFILPNDRVDVIRTVRDDDGSRSSGSEVQTSETLIPNVRVLAIGDKVEEKGGEKRVTGQHATLELDPRQAEQIVLAQRVGQLSLALRSLSDSGQDFTATAPADGPLTVIRYGVSSSAGKR